MCAEGGGAGQSHVDDLSGPRRHGQYPRADADGLSLEDYFLQPEDAAERAVAWAAEAGHEVNAGPLLDVLTVDPDPAADLLAENLFFRLLDRLGVVPQ